MTRRKKSGESWEAHIDRQIREARERGEFDGLSGLGAPIPGLDKPYDELWWLRKLLKREDLSFLPPALELRLDLEKTLERVARQRSEAGVRRIVALLNARIRKVNATTTSGPSSNVVELDPDEVVRRWKSR